jgi:uncharacterized protein DUF3761
MSIKTIVSSVVVFLLFLQPTPAKTQGTPAARCSDGTNSYTASRLDACSRHGGVAAWNIPADATARCNDGTYSSSTTLQETCSDHGGVAERYSWDQAYIAAMKSDLRNLVTAEASFFAESVKYTDRIGARGLTYAVTSGNTLPRITLTTNGWQASISNRSTRTRCMIFIGLIKNPPAITEGVPACVAF